MREGRRDSEKMLWGREKGGEGSEGGGRRGRGGTWKGTYVRIEVEGEE